MFQIMHKCHPGMDYEDYAIAQKWTDDSPRRPLTQIVCPKCKEQFFVLGHEMFEEAREFQSARSSSLPPGFVIPHLKRT